LGLFLLWDLYGSYGYYVQTAIAGDLVGIVLPTPDYARVLDNPLGFDVLMTGEGYVGTNRFWAHYITMLYFNNIPFLLQDLGVSPIDSLYVAAALLKLLTQLGMMLLLSKWVVGKKSMFSLEALAVTAFVGTFFFTADTYLRGFDLKGYVALIDMSIAYAIFYATSIFLLMLYLHPFLQRIRGFQAPEMKLWQHVVLVLFSFVVSFNGPINSPTILILCPLLLLGLWVHHFRKTAAGASVFQKALTAIERIPRAVLLHFVWLGLLNLYAFYLGTFNAENPTVQPTLAERYALLWQGFYDIYVWNRFHPSPLGILFIWILVNTGLIARFLSKGKRQHYLWAFALIVVFFIAYTSLIPLGGYRPYRPMVIRYDVVIPTTLGILFLFFYSSYLLLQQFKKSVRLVYALPLLGLMVFFTIIDHSPSPPNNECEYRALQVFAQAEEKIVQLPYCTVLSWYFFIPPDGSGSTPVSKYLYRVNVIDDKEKRFYHVKPQ
jgi:hypothetical protein